MPPATRGYHLLGEVCSGCGHPPFSRIARLLTGPSTCFATYERTLLDGRSAPWSPYAVEQTPCS